ncbi:hypothetical protein BC826DRAFT_214045 [Russula brevipes]|nr:hypothetical protein BC826DRAFT_214045 [Russula brevipes]
MSDVCSALSRKLAGYCSMSSCHNSDAGLALRCVCQIYPSYGGWGRRTAKPGFFQGTHYGTDERLASWQQRKLCVGSKMMASPDKQCRSRLPIHYAVRYIQQMYVFSVERPGQTHVQIKDFDGGPPQRRSIDPAVPKCSSRHRIPTTWSTRSTF